MQIQNKEIMKLVENRKTDLKKGELESNPWPRVQKPVELPLSPDVRVWSVSNCCIPGIPSLTVSTETASSIIGRTAYKERNGAPVGNSAFSSSNNCN